VHGNNAAELLAPIEVPTEGDRADRIRVTTQALADVLASAIREHPEHWHMLQRLWLADLDPRRLAQRDAAAGRAAAGADVADPHAADPDDAVGEPPARGA
jgi:KDO2-lipid IV(A) lauroyltransferase